MMEYFVCTEQGETVIISKVVSKVFKEQMVLSYFKSISSSKKPRGVLTNTICPVTYDKLLKWVGNKSSFKPTSNVIFKNAHFLIVILIMLKDFFACNS